MGNLDTDIYEIYIVIHILCVGHFSFQMVKNQNHVDTVTKHKMTRRLTDSHRFLTNAQIMLELKRI